jgi:hypothetical protein
VNGIQKILSIQKYHWIICIVRRNGTINTRYFDWCMMNSQRYMIVLDDNILESELVELFRTIVTVNNSSNVVATSRL